MDTVIEYIHELDYFWILSCSQSSSQFPLLLSVLCPFLYSTNSKCKNHFKRIYFCLPLKLIQKYLLIPQMAFTDCSDTLFFSALFFQVTSVGFCWPSLVPVFPELICLACKANILYHYAQHMVLGKSSAKKSAQQIFFFS